jgi:hypothetical protein
VALGRWRSPGAHHLSDAGVANGANAMGVGEQHGPVEESGFGNPGGARHLTVAVEREMAGEHRSTIVPPSRPNRRDAGANPIAVDQCPVTDFDAANIGDCVERAWLAWTRDAELAGAGPSHGERCIASSIGSRDGALPAAYESQGRSP